MASNAMTVRERAAPHGDAWGFGTLEGARETRQSSRALFKTRESSVAI